jgi:XRE family aerobic/anaerobic benzoate catabolism transcriptional regulator
MRKRDAVIDLLAVVGQRVRTAREARGESRARLAERAGLSPRFLAQLEGGAGNISILRLRDVAQALELEWAALLPGADASPGSPRAATVGSTPAAGVRAAGVRAPAGGARVAALQDEIAAYLEARSLDELREVRDGLAARFTRSGGPLVALLGLRGAGKSSVGQRLARALRVEFHELDTLIEEAAGMQLAQLFELQGPTRYRQLERDTLRRFLATTQAGVLATGGGIVTEPETFALLRKRCFTVWLRAKPEEHWERVVRQGDRRPMRGNPDAMHELRALLAARQPLYAQAHFMLDTSGATPVAVGRRLAQVVREQARIDSAPRTGSRRKRRRAARHPR